MQTKHKEQLSTQENVENNHNSDLTLMDKENIEGTPFTIISFLKEGETEKKHFFAFGKHRLSNDFKTKEELNEYIDNNMWTIVTNLIVIITETYANMLLENINKISNNAQEGIDLLTRSSERIAPTEETHLNRK